VALDEKEYEMLSSTRTFLALEYEGVDGRNKKMSFFLRLSLLQTLSINETLVIILVCFEWLHKKV